MKFKLNSKTLVVLLGVFLIGTMLFSVFAGPLLQSFNSAKDLKLPDTNIIDYQLDPNLRNALIQYGTTVVTFEYNLGCNNCVNQKATLEFLATEYKQQIWLEEIRDDNLDQSRITISSLYGEETLVDVNDTEVVASLCNLMVAPPTTCVLQIT